MDTLATSTFQSQQTGTHQEEKIRLAKDTVFGIDIETVSLPGTSHIFETVIRGGWYNRQETFYSTVGEALEEHARRVRRIKMMWWIPPKLQGRICLVWQQMCWNLRFLWCCVRIMRSGEDETTRAIYYEDDV